MNKSHLLLFIGVISFHVHCLAGGDQLQKTSYPNFELRNAGSSTIYYKLFVDKMLATNWAMIEWKSLDAGKSERATFAEMVALAIAEDEATKNALTLKTFPTALKESKALIVRLNRDRSNAGKTFYLSASIINGQLAINPTTIDTSKPEYKDIPADKNISNADLQHFKERTAAMIEAAM